MRNRTSFVIAHRLSTVRSADRIIVLEQRPHRRDAAPRRIAGPDAAASTAACTRCRCSGGTTLASGPGRARRRAVERPARRDTCGSGQHDARDGRPMIVSMTGFAAATRETDDLAVNVTLRSVNHRHLDVQFRLPQSLQALETALRPPSSSASARGRLEVAMTVQERVEPVTVVEVERDAGPAAVGAAVEPRPDAGPGRRAAAARVTCCACRRCSRFAKSARPSIRRASKRWSGGALDEALEALNEMRRREGAVPGHRARGASARPWSALVRRLAKRPVTRAPPASQQRLLQRRGRAAARPAGGRARRGAGSGQVRGPVRYPRGTRAVAGASGPLGRSDRRRASRSAESSTFCCRR